MLGQRFLYSNYFMATETPFAHLQRLSNFNDELTDIPLEVRKNASVGASELSRGPNHERHSLDESYLWNGGISLLQSQSMEQSHTLANPFDVGELLTQINSCKVTGQDAQQHPLHGNGSLGRSESLSSLGGPTTISDGTNRSLRWIQPSGARQPGQGCEDVEQGIVYAEQTPTGGAIVRITLLAAGFIIGPSGSSVRDICRMCGTDIKSWTCASDEICTRPTRQFRVEGSPLAVARSLEVTCDAVQRYKELCEGKYAGQSVPRIQHISGIDFSYQPPPRNIVPYAASLKSQGSSKRAGGGRPPTAPSQKDGLGRATSLGLSTRAGPSPFPTPSKSSNISITRSSSLPPLSRSRNTSPAPGDAAAAPPQVPHGKKSLSVGGTKGSRGSLDSLLEEGNPHSADSLSSTPAMAARKESRGSLDSAKGSPGALDRGCQQPSSPFAALASKAAETQDRSEAVEQAGEGGRGSDRASNKKDGRKVDPTAPQGAHPPAAARTLGKSEVMRSVFSGMSSVDQAGSASYSASPLLQQLALQHQQHQHHLAATAAAAQAAFPNRNSLLADLAGAASTTKGGGGDPLSAASRLATSRQVPLQSGIGGWVDEDGAAGMGVLGGVQQDQQQLLLQAAMAALGLSPESSAADAAHQARQALLGMASGGGFGGEDLMAAHPAWQRAATGLVPPPLAGPGTPTPTPVTATPYPSPGQQHTQQQQVLAALQALAASSASPYKGPGTNWSSSAHGSPAPSQRNSEESLQDTLSASPVLPSPEALLASLAAATTAGMLGTPTSWLESGAGLPVPTGSPVMVRESAPAAFPIFETPPAAVPGINARAAPSDLPSYGSAGAYSAFGSPGILVQPQGASVVASGGPAGEAPPFLSAFGPSPAASGFSLSRASSLAFAEGPTQPRIRSTAGSLGSAGRSLSLPAHNPFDQPSAGRAGSLFKEEQCLRAVPGEEQGWGDHWDEMLASAALLVDDGAEGGAMQGGSSQQSV